LTLDLTVVPLRTQPRPDHCVVSPQAGARSPGGSVRFRARYIQTSSVWPPCRRTIVAKSRANPAAAATSGQRWYNVSMSRRSGSPRLGGSSSSQRASLLAGGGQREGFPPQPGEYPCRSTNYEAVGIGLRGPVGRPSVVSHAVCILSSTARARRTFSRIASALAVQTNDRGFSL
jgi:hypothetical protein